MVEEYSMEELCDFLSKREEAFEKGMLDIKMKVNYKPEDYPKITDTWTIESWGESEHTEEKYKKIYQKYKNYIKFVQLLGEIEKAKEETKRNPYVSNVQLAISDFEKAKEEDPRGYQEFLKISEVFEEILE